jgi:hypothetical protein
MRSSCRMMLLAAITTLGLLGIVWVLGASAQTSPVELTRTDVTTLKTLDASQWVVLGVRLGDQKAAALKTLQGLKEVKVQDEAAAGRIFVIAPPTSNTLVMSLKVVEGRVTTINLVNTFGDWLQGDTKLLFKAYEDDSLRHKLLGREDHRDFVQGGTKETPTVDVTFSYFKEGIILHSGAKRSADGKQVESLREMILIYPARVR